ncbi:hypothetical protein CC86DRAFT_367052 [Ophiobolus disseminans]|uniref:Uncharacterized protein n=1 Tax=Ophiobolus disseminans TaxID=1469910 RepID=A0A6A7AGR7_9PLEO|nr:hypothetical protein CC86DRAFT_367052 [Ophiobolus disseminans]
MIATTSTLLRITILATNIIKERVRRKLHNINTIDELRAALQQEWKAVTQDQIQARINEMPYRVGQVFAHPDKRCKTSLW